MPWFVVAAGSAAMFARLMRGSLIETMDEDYIRTARAKGLTERRVVVRHGVRAAINPIVTILWRSKSACCSAAPVLVETVFNIPGSRPAGLHRDRPRRLPKSIQGTVLLASMFIIIANIVVDIAYAYLDPRVRYS